MRVEGQQGFLMLDVILAMLVIAIALVTVAGMFTQSMRATASASGYTLATNIAQQELENFKEKIESQNDQTLNNIDNYPYHPADVTKTDPLVCTVRMSANVLGDKSRGESDPDNKIVAATVTVLWKERGRDYSVQLSTYCLRNTLYSAFPK